MSELEELARVLEPEAWKEEDKCKRDNLEVSLDLRMKIMTSLIHSRKAIDYIKGKG